MHDFAPLPIATAHRDTPDCLVLTFTVPHSETDAFRYRPGQHMAVRAMLGGEEVRRTYSICSGPDAPALSIAIKRIDGGRFSNWAFDTLKPGMTLDAMPPSGRFVLPDPPGARPHVLAFAAGAGITPIMSMAAHTMLDQWETRFTLVYGNRDIDSVIFRERLENLKDAHLDRFTLVNVLSRQEESDTPLLEGRVTAEKVTAMAGHVFDLADVDHAFLCGPGSMIRDVRNALIALGIPRERVHHEFFAPTSSSSGAQPPIPTSEAITQPAAPPPARRSAPDHRARITAADVVAILDGTRHRFTARPGESILSAALRTGLRPPYSCKGGMCSTCRAQLVEGRAPMTVNYSLEPWELEKGFVLTCQAVPQGPVVVDYDQM